MPNRRNGHVPPIRRPVSGVGDHVVSRGRLPGPPPGPAGPVGGGRTRRAPLIPRRGGGPSGGRTPPSSPAIRRAGLPWLAGAAAALAVALTGTDLLTPAPEEQGSSVSVSLDPQEAWRYAPLYDLLGCAPWGPPSPCPRQSCPWKAAWRRGRRSFPTRPSWRRGRIGSPTRGWRRRSRNL